MAVLWTEGFEGGGNLVTVTTDNTSLSKVTQVSARPTFRTSSKHSGSLSATTEWLGPGTATVGFARYIKFLSPMPNIFSFWNRYGEGTILASMTFTMPSVGSGGIVMGYVYRPKNIDRGRAVDGNGNPMTADYSAFAGITDHENESLLFAWTRNNVLYHSEIAVEGPPGGNPDPNPSNNFGWYQSVYELSANSVRVSLYNTFSLDPVHQFTMNGEVDYGVSVGASVEPWFLRQETPVLLTWHAYTDDWMLSTPLESGWNLDVVKRY